MVSFALERRGLHGVVSWALTMRPKKVRVEQVAKGTSSVALQKFSDAGHKGAARGLYVAKSVVRNGLGWGFFAGMYLGLNCGVETVRRKSDWMNATIAGAITGGLAAARSGSGVRMLQTATLVAAIATAGDYVRPVQYPPTGI